MGSVERSAPSTRVDGMRRLAEVAYRTGNAELLDVAWQNFANWTRDLLAFAPGDPDLPQVQEIALDFETALEGVGNDGASDARRLASEVLITINMVERNPADQIARRPTAMRVLRALLSLGMDARLADVRAASGLKATHLSNILKPLVSHGFVTVVADPNDGRNRRINLTSRGFAAAGAIQPTEEPGSKDYQDRIHREPARARHYSRQVRVHAADGGAEDAFRSSVASRSSLAAA